MAREIRKFACTAEGAAKVPTPLVLTPTFNDSVLAALTC
jgi:hypothetical protein